MRYKSKVGAPVDKKKTQELIHSTQACRALFEFTQISDK